MKSIEERTSYSTWESESQKGRNRFPFRWFEGLKSGTMTRWFLLCRVGLKCLIDLRVTNFSLFCIWSKEWCELYQSILNYSILISGHFLLHLCNLENKTKDWSFNSSEYQDTYQSHFLIIANHFSFSDRPTDWCIFRGHIRWSYIADGLTVRFKGVDRECSVQVVHDRSSSCVVHRLALTGDRQSRAGRRGRWCSWTTSAVRVRVDDPLLSRALADEGIDGRKRSGAHVSRQRDRGDVTVHSSWVQSTGPENKSFKWVIKRRLLLLLTWNRSNTGWRKQETSST